MTRAYFNEDQLNTIYEQAGKSVDQDALLSVAKRLYPDVIDIDGRPPVFVRIGAGKAFLVDGAYAKAAYSILSNYGHGIGVMENGDTRPY